MLGYNNDNKRNTFFFFFLTNKSPHLDVMRMTLDSLYGLLYRYRKYRPSPAPESRQVI